MLNEKLFFSHPGNDECAVNNLRTKVKKITVIGFSNTCFAKQMMLNVSV